MNKHLLGDDLHFEVRACGVLYRFDLSDSKLDRLKAQIIDAHHEYRPAVRLELSGGRPDQDLGALLPRDEGRLPVPHESLLLWAGGLE
ncbi:hypothetical protein ACVWWO_000959 [Bradyrhizobium sp. F1.13.1]